MIILSKLLRKRVVYCDAGPWYMLFPGDEMKLVNESVFSDIISKFLLCFQAQSGVRVPARTYQLGFEPHALNSHGSLHLCENSFHSRVPDSQSRIL